MTENILYHVILISCIESVYELCSC